jgi:hypothetical protein
VNLAPDVAKTLRDIADARGITITEAIRRCIGVYDFVDEQRSKRNRLAVIETSGTQERVREVLIFN